MGNYEDTEIPDTPGPSSECEVVTGCVQWSADDSPGPVAGVRGESEQGGTFSEETQHCPSPENTLISYIHVDSRL